MILSEKKFVSLHHKIDKQTILSPLETILSPLETILSPLETILSLTKY